MTDAFKRAAIYVRVSTDMQVEEGESIPAQRDRLARWARENGYTIVADYTDAGESARAADRPEFLRMMADAREKPRPFDAILVWKWDRFARNADDAVVYKQLLRRQLGLDLIAVGDPRSDGAVGVLMERILDVVAEFQSLTTAEHVKNTMMYLAQQGRWLGKVPFGYQLDNGKLAIREDEAKAVRWAFEQIARREASVTSIAEAFASGNAFPSTRQRGYRWSYQAASNMLRNAVYVGEVRWNRRSTAVTAGGDGISRKRVGRRRQSEWITVENAHPAIVDRELFAEVQRVLHEIGGRYSGRSKYGDYLFRGLVRCARCGGRLVWYAPENGSRPRLVCSAYFRVRSVACRPLNSIHVDSLAATVAEAINSVAEGVTPPDLQIAVDRTRTTRAPGAALEAVQQRLQRLLDAYEGGALTLDEFRQRRALLDAETARLESLLREELGEGRPDAQLVERLRRKAREVLPVVLGPESDRSVAQQNAALAAIIDRITVDRQLGSVQIVWRVPAED